MVQYGNCHEQHMKLSFQLELSNGGSDIQSIPFSIKILNNPVKGK